MGERAGSGVACGAVVSAGFGGAAPSGLGAGSAGFAGGAVTTGGAPALMPGSASGAWPCDPIFHMAAAPAPPSSSSATNPVPTMRLRLRPGLWGIMSMLSSLTDSARSLMVVGSLPVMRGARPPRVFPRPAATVRTPAEGPPTSGASMAPRVARC